MTFCIEYSKMASIVLIVCTLTGIQAFPGGAPFTTCYTRYPIHGNALAQTSANPYSITLSATNYNLGDTVKVTISSHGSSTPIMGFQITAIRESCPLEIVGKFDDTISSSKSMAFSCAGVEKNMVTHRNSDRVNSVEFEWTALSNDSGNVIFQATVLKDYGTFWTNVSSILYSNGPERSCSYPEIVPTSLTRATDFSSCGDTKACFLYPRTLKCKDNNCVAAVSFEYRATTSDILVEMYADPGPSVDYVGVAFSTDDDMGDDETFVCTASGLVMGLQHGYNEGEDNERLRTESVIQNGEVRNEDGRIQCRFVIPNNFTLTTLDLTTVTSNAPITKSRVFDKNDGWRIHLAWGPVIQDSDVILIHKDMPATTSSKVLVKEPGIYRGSAYHGAVKIHASLMIIAWTFLSGILTVIARHYRDMMPKRRLFHTKIWFQIHRSLAILVAVMTVFAVILIFVARGLIKGAAAPHAACGLIVTIFLILQVVIAFRRPGLDHKRRLLFNWGHKILGQLTHVFAAITMFLAFKIDYVTESMSDFGLIALGVWLCVQLVWHLAFEIASYFLMKTDPATDSGVIDVTKNKGTSWIPTAMMVIYVICLVGCCASVMCAFLLF